MLKIKDNVDLKELKKYGFEYHPMIYVKDKIIKDLKERNDKLTNQYRLKDIRCIFLERELKGQAEEYQKALDITMSEKMDLEEKVNNAIERLNTLIVFWKKYNPIDNTMQVEQFKGVIGILGDVDDE